MNDKIAWRQADELLAALWAGRLTRRQVLQRAAALGLGAAAFGQAVALPGTANGTTLAQEAGSELIVAASGDVDTLDPHVSQLILYGNMMRFTCFSSLVRYGPSLEYLPDLAESWESPDGMTYTFKLRPGATYHDGTAVEASHVEFSFKRIAEKQTVWSSRVANIATYQVVDPATIRITLTGVQADFIDGLVPLSIISPAAAETIEDEAIGSGPFKLIEWVPNDHIALERNPDYFESGVPGVDRLTFRIIKEPQVAITNLQAGEVGGVLDLPVAQAVPLKGSTEITPLIVPTSGFLLFEMLGKNSEPVRTSVQVRQALAHCLDKDAIQQTVYSGEGKQKWSFVGTTSWAYKEEAGYPYDPEKAKALLADAGQASGLELSAIVATGFPDGEQALTIWQAGLAEAGVKLNIEVQELSVWLDNYINHTYDISWNVFPGFADPNYFVGLGLRPHLEDGWQNAEAARLADEANAVLDQAQRAELYGRLQDLTVAELPIIVVQEIPQASLVKPDVTGWEINRLGYVLVRGVKVGGA